MPPPHTAKCRSCSFAWFSATMADGLRVLGCCPRCRGELEFAAPVPGAAPPREEPPVDATLPPHLVLGRPRR